MRWFVEVSRVGENSSDEKYCVEAKQWQAALQEARKLRGDSGPLSKFSIELLDDGYRAVDPKLKLRFVVAKAPHDAELSTESAVRPDGPHLNGQATSVAPPAVMTPSVAAPAPVAAAPVAPAPTPLATAPTPAPVAPAPAPVVAAVAPAPVTTAPITTAPVVALAPSAVTPASGMPSPIVAAPIPAPAPAASAAHAEPYAGVPSSALSPNAPPAVAGVQPLAPAPAAPAPIASAPAPAPIASAPAPAPIASAPAPAPIASASPSASAAAAPVTVKSSGSAFPPRPGSVRPPSVKPPPGITVPVDTIPAAPAVPKGLGPPVGLPQSFTQPSAAIDLPPPSTLLRKRQEEPTPETPITYREVAYVVDPGVSRGSVEALLWASFRDISRELAERAGQKFVQLAVFDHRFEKKPERPPLGTLAWKDWRGNPVLTFPLFDGTAPARVTIPAPSIKPIPVVKISSSAPPAAPAPAPAVAPSEPAPALPASVAAALASAPAPAAVEAPLTTAAPVVVAVPPAVESVPPPPAPQVVAVAPSPVEADLKSDAQAAAIPLTREKMPSQPSAARASKPRLPAVRRRAGEDLIGELFETMHDLHFMQGVADGAEFMLAAVESIVPCDGVLIHVFDINTRQFVVVRAKGPGTMQVLLHRTPDTDPFFNAIMRRPGSIAIADVAADPRVLGPRWDALGVIPQRALCGPVRQGGRYLGLLEVANPLGDAPFHQTEQNAIDYVCEQFAEFLANRPIVLDADVILRR